jgi:hypothetical protein
MLLIMAGCEFIEKGFLLSLRGNFLKDDIAINLTKMARTKCPLANSLYDIECMTLGEILCMTTATLLLNPGRYDKLSEDKLLSAIKALIDQAVITDVVTNRINDIVLNKIEVLN